MEAMQHVRTRIGPSPTGYPHIGTIYQVLFDYAYAKRFGGRFIVRIEDTDRARFVADAEQVVFDSIDWFGLTEDESVRNPGDFGPYRQSERLSLYQMHIQTLLDQGHAYYCFCTKERLDAVRKQQQSEKRSIVMYDKHCRYLPKDEVQQKLSEGVEKVIRLKVPEDEMIVARDEIRGNIEFDSNLVDDQVLLKADGFPTYHLAVVVDDHSMQISHVVRGEDWLPSFPKHVVLYRFFGWSMPLFYHTSNLRNQDKTKLSKRHGHTNVSWYREEGYLPEAILNYIASLGWGHPDGKEIFSLDEFIQLFDLRDITPVGPVFDLVKLTWMNGEYIRMMTNEQLKAALIRFFTAANDTIMLAYLRGNDLIMDEVMSLVKSRMKTLKDFKDLPLPLESSYSLTDSEKEIAVSLRNGFENILEWNKERILESMKTIMQRYNIKGNVLYKVLTGRDRGLPLPDSLEMLGKDEVLRRFEKIL